MLKSWFFTATDTGIGKTTVTAACAFAMRNKGIRVGVMKPFATGDEQKNDYKSDDVRVLLAGAGTSDPQDVVNPYFFPVPASPYTAARKMGKTIHIDLVIERFQSLQAKYETVLVEGIGGILTPITRDYYVACLIRDLGTDVILVTSSKIGAVNHTLLTHSACKKYGLNVRGIVINEVPGGYNAAELAEDLKNLCGADVLCVIPYMNDPDVSKISEVVRSSELMSLLVS